MKLSIEEKRIHQREASKRWKERNPEAYKRSWMANETKRKGKRPKQTPEYCKKRRLIRLAEPGYKELLNKKANERSKKIKEFLAEFKLSKSCTDCSYNKHHAALDFDHVRGVKSFNVAFAKSISQAKIEIEKCEVVCSNCHRIRTYNNLKNM